MNPGRAAQALFEITISTLKGAAMDIQEFIRRMTRMATDSKYRISSKDREAAGLALRMILKRGQTPDEAAQKAPDPDPEQKP